MTDTDALIKALEVGNQGLTHGSALQVEDLDATLKCVTFDCGIVYTATQFNRLLRHLNERAIPYTLSRKAYTEQRWFLSPNTTLKVGRFPHRRKLVFSVV